MIDYISFFEQYKDIKEILDLINEVNCLRMYFNTQQYGKMQQYIRDLAGKYLVETLTWNAVHPSMPTNPQQAYLSAENFLRLKGFSLLLEKGIKLNEQLTSEELNFIKSTIKPRE